MSPPPRQPSPPEPTATQPRSTAPPSIGNTSERAAPSSAGPDPAAADDGRDAADEALGDAVEDDSDPETFAPSDPGEGGLADGAHTGTAEFTRWGDVQVEVTISDGQIVDVATVQVPSDGRSQSINAQAEPLLEEQAIAIQGAELDIVSGATATSEAYAASLQAAVDQATLEAGETVPG